MPLSLSHGGKYTGIGLADKEFAKDRGTSRGLMP